MNLRAFWQNRRDTFFVGLPTRYGILFELSVVAVIAIAFIGDIWARTNHLPIQAFDIFFYFMMGFMLCQIGYARHAKKRFLEAKARADAQLEELRQFAFRTGRTNLIKDLQP